MISNDMKYTALYWALRFFETEEDIHRKDYDGYRVTVHAARQEVDYGDRIAVLSDCMRHLNRHKDFVILECVDRLLTAGTPPANILLDGRDGMPDIVADGRKIYCEQWGRDYLDALGKDFGDGLVYTSRLFGGLIERQTSDMPPQDVRTEGGFAVRGDTLLYYSGKESSVEVPEGIRYIAPGAFWSNVWVREVSLPGSLQRLGGDCFYGCLNLERVNIPENLALMGCNPFGGCPKLHLENRSPHFRLEDGALYDADGKRIIYCEIANPRTFFEIPQGVACIGKHCFYACENLERIAIPESVVRMENNPFSGCPRLSLENRSPRYVVEDGIIYNGYRSTLIACLNGVSVDRFVVPDSVTLISRNAFWNCRGVRGLVIGKNVDRIGYNPFASCENMLIESESPDFPCIGGIVYDRDGTEILCATDPAAGKEFRVRDGITHIGRGAFSGCKSLERVDLNGVTYLDKNAFANCRSLRDIRIPDGVTFIGEWAFGYCKSLERVSAPRGALIDRNAFNECPAAIDRRD